MSCTGTCRLCGAGWTRPLANVRRDVHGPRGTVREERPTCLSTLSIIRGRAANYSINEPKDPAERGRHLSSGRVPVDDNHDDVKILYADTVRTTLRVRIYVRGRARTYYITYGGRIKRERENAGRGDEKGVQRTLYTYIGTPGQFGCYCRRTVSRVFGAAEKPL